MTARNLQLFIELLEAEAQVVNEAQRTKGFHDDYLFIRDAFVEGDVRLDQVELMFTLSQLGLMGTEVTEMIEAVRKPCESEKIPGFTQEEEEAADLQIRLLHFAGRRKLRLGEAYRAKMAYNLNRPHKHGKQA